MQTTFDTVMKIGESLLQHGKHSDRVYLMKLGAGDMPSIVDNAMRIAMENDYSKVFAKVPESQGQEFLDRKFIIEAEVPGFFSGMEKGLFLAKYLDPLREMSANRDECRQVLSIVRQKMEEEFAPKPLGEKWVIRELDPGEARHAAAVYQLVFETYPFPIHEESYIRQTMRENVKYFGVYYDIELVALASAEMDVLNRNAEMTDFATLPEHLGNHLAVHLLRRMEDEVRDLGIKTSYTIARSVSVGMNLTFARCGYQFGGTLYANTNISGGIESMNVWYKPL